jgi:subfamily B ATP-binding cassette protein MsbA
VTETELDRVCEIARVDEFFDDLPDGYETMLGDDGVRLSGGQKQRVALARALLEDADLLVLDEATSDLDSNLEQEVQAAIEAMDRDYAMITIAHRLSTVQNADRIYTMDNGRVTEVGTHSELLANGGQYEELYTIQSEG